MLEKSCWTQFFEFSEYFINLLIINELYIKPPFSPSNTARNLLTFRFLFRHTSKTVNYTLLNISAEANCLFYRFPVLFQKIYAENFSNLLSARICSALSLPRQCAEKTATVRWKFARLVDWRKELFAKNK